MRSAKTIANRDTASTNDVMMKRLMVMLTLKSAMNTVNSTMHRSAAFLGLVITGKMTASTICWPVL